MRPLGVSWPAEARWRGMAAVWSGQSPRLASCLMLMVESFAWACPRTSGAEGAVRSSPWATAGEGWLGKGGCHFFAWAFALLVFWLGFGASVVFVKV